MDLTTGSNDTSQPGPAASRRLDAASLFYEIGREVQTVALVMRKHEIVDAQQTCACGRLPVHTLPFFGPRCEVAGERFALAEAAMRRVVAQSTAPRAVGRAQVR
jgi:hypothetical protein